MPYRGVFLAVLLGTALLVAAFLVNRARPRGEVDQPTAALIRASGKCAECHRRETSAVVHEFEISRHATANVTCFDCHQVVGGQDQLDHRGFPIAKEVTAANCKQCHPTEYGQFLRSRHAAPAWAAVAGQEDFSPTQKADVPEVHRAAVRRKPHPLVAVEGEAGVSRGCVACHDIGRPNKDGSIGTCTKCHARHAASVEQARLPETCGQCHMGPDHSQIEIYNESKHGVLFHGQRAKMNLAARPSQTTTADMPVPTCSTCHMGGIDGLKVSHDTTERLSYFLFADISEARPNADQQQKNMKEVCLKCHTTPHVERFYTEAVAVLESTNEKVKEASDLMEALRTEGLLTKAPFDEPIEFVYFDLWHYFGRTAKHGAFMGGADFVQWHGFYELAAKINEIKHMAEELRAKKAQEGATASAAPAAATPETPSDAPANPPAFAPGAGQ